MLLVAFLIGVVMGSLITILSVGTIAYILYYNHQDYKDNNL